MSLFAPDTGPSPSESTSSTKRNTEIRCDFIKDSLSLPFDLDALIVPQAGRIPHRKGRPGTGRRNGQATNFERGCSLWRTFARRTFFVAHACARPFKMKRGTPSASPAQASLLLLIDKMATAVLLPASFVAFCAERFLLAVADGLDPAGVDARRSQRVFHGTGALVAQGQVVIGRAALVAVSFNRQVDIGMLIEERHIGLDRRLLVGANISLVVVEVHVFNVLAEQVFVRHRWSGRRRRWRRLRDRELRGRFLRAARSLGRQMISRRSRRRHALRTVRLNGANAVDRHIGRIAGLPGQSRRLSGLNRVRTHRNGSGWGRGCRRGWWRRRSCFLSASAKRQ